MKNKHYIAFLTTTLLCISMLGGQMSKIEVRYIPFQIETYVAVDVQAIFKKPLIALSKEDEISLRKEFESAVRIHSNDFTFQEGRTRLMAKIDDTTYVCDASGNCMSNKFDMIVVNVERLKKILNKYHDKKFVK